MPQQLIYTSSERGLVVGRSGYCTVACSEGMREALQSRLEQLSQYEHATIAGRHPAICAYRVIAIRGARFHVLSRMVDAGLDFTSRTNFTAHHLVFDPAEVASMASPPLVFLHWDGWRDKWAGEPQWLRNEHWGNLYSLPAPSLAPCLNWQALTGDAANAAALLDARPETFLADGLDHTRSLALLAETLAVQVARPGGGQAWQTPFTTFLQEGDDAADFRWRLVYSATPAHARLLVAGLAPRPLRELRAGQVDELTVAYARSGPQPLQITAQPEDLTLSEGQTLVLRVGVRALPAPQRYQWSQKRVQSAWTELPGQNGNTLQIPHYSDPGQISRFKVVIWDAGGKPTESSEAKVQVRREKSLTIAPAPDRRSPSPDLPDDALPVQPKHHNSIGWGVDESIRTGAPTRKGRWGVWLAVVCVVVAALVLLGWGFQKVLVEAGVISAPTYAPAKTSSEGNTSASSAATDVAQPAPASGPKLVFQEPPPRKLPRAYLLMVANPLDAAATNRLKILIEKKKKEVQGKKTEITKLPEKLTDAVKTAESKLTELGKEVERAGGKVGQGLEDRIKTARKQLAEAQDAVKPARQAVAIHNLNYDLAGLQAEQVRLSNELNNLNNYAKFSTTLDAAQKTKVVPQLTNLCAVSSNHPAFSYTEVSYPSDGTAKTNTLDVRSSDRILPTTLGMKFDIEWLANTNGIDTHLAIIGSTNRAIAPFILSFTQDTSLARPEVELVVWPSGNIPVIQATADQNGLIQTGNSQATTGLMEALARLPQDSFRLELRISYLDNKCSASFPYTNTTFTFEALAEMMKANASGLPRLERWELVINRLTQLQQQFTTSKDYSGYRDLRATNVWADLDRMCQYVVNGRLGAYAQGYLFDQNPTNTAADVLPELAGARRSEDDSIVKSLEDVLQRENITQLEKMVNSTAPEQGSEAGHGLTILQIKNVVENQLARCRLDPARLKGSICFQFKWDGEPPKVQEIELVHFRFDPRASPNSARP